MTGFNEFEVDGKPYRATNMDTFTQLHVARRIAPLLTPLLPAMTKALNAAAQGGKVAPDGVPSEVMPLVIEALGRMPEDDLNYIVEACLAVVQRQSGPGWQRVRAPGGGFMFEDINLVAMLTIVWNVIQGDVGSFFRAIPPQNSTEAAG